VSDSTPIADVLAEDTRDSARGRYGWLSILVAALFGLFYAFDVWEAIGNMVNLPVYYAAFNLDSAAIPWWLLILGLLAPIAIFALAFLVGRRRNLGVKALLFLTGLAVSAGASLTVIALEALLRPAF
jgi:uncharacterized membrane protein